MIITSAISLATTHNSFLKYLAQHNMILDNCTGVKCGYWWNDKKEKYIVVLFGFDRAFIARFIIGQYTGGGLGIAAFDILPSNADEQFISLSKEEIDQANDAMAASSGDDRMPRGL